MTPREETAGGKNRTVKVGGLLAALANVVTIAAGAVAIAGIWVWIDEASDRADERAARQQERLARDAEAEARRVSLIGEAHSAIALEAADGHFDVARSPHAAWALSTLQRYQVPILINAERVELRDIDIACADLTVKATELEIDGARLLNSVVQIEADEIRVRGSGILGTDVSASRANASDLRHILIEASEVSGSSIASARDEIEIGGLRVYKTAVAGRITVSHSRVSKSSFTSDGPVLRFNLVGPDQTVQVPGVACPHAGMAFVDCGSIGASAKPYQVDTDIGVTTEWTIDLADPGCAKPRAVRGARFATMKFN